MRRASLAPFRYLDEVALAYLDDIAGPRRTDDGLHLLPVNLHAMLGKKPFHMGLAGGHVAPGEELPQVHEELAACQLRGRGRLAPALCAHVNREAVPVPGVNPKVGPNGAMPTIGAPDRGNHKLGLFRRLPPLHHALEMLARPLRRLLVMERGYQLLAPAAS